MTGSSIPFPRSTHRYPVLPGLAGCSLTHTSIMGRVGRANPVLTIPHFSWLVINENQVGRWHRGHSLRMEGSVSAAALPVHILTPRVTPTLKKSGFSEILVIFTQIILLRFEGRAMRCPQRTFQCLSLLEPPESPCQPGAEGTVTRACYYHSNDLLAEMGLKIGVL